MEHLIEYIDKDIIVRLPTGEYSDGETVYLEVPAKGRFVNAVARDVELWGNMQSNRIVLVSCPKALNLPCQIVADGKTYDVVNLRECRGLKADIIVWRCQV